MIHNPMNVWLLRPGVRGFGDLPSYLDDTDARPAAEQFGERWRPIEAQWRLEGSAVHGDGQVHELLGAIRLQRELVMLFENDLIAIVASDRSFEVSRIPFEVSWLDLSDNSPTTQAAAG